jgi:hypothetical protein
MNKEQFSSEPEDEGYSQAAVQRQPLVAHG